MIRNKEYLNQLLNNKNFLLSKLKKFIFRNCNLNKCNFWESDLSNSKFQKTKIYNSIFTDANLSKSSFINSEIKDTNFTHTNLKGVNFKSSKLININLRDAVYDKSTIWPSNFNPEQFGAIESKNFNLFSYKRKLSFKTIKNLPNKEINIHKKKIKKEKDMLSKKEKKIVYELTKGKGYIILKNFYNKKKINKAEKIISKKLKKNIKYKKVKSNYAIDKINKSINFFDILNEDKVFTDMIQPKIVMNAFKRLMGKSFICTYYAAQCSLAGSRGQSLHLDYPYVSYNHPGEKIPFGMGSENYLLSCGILTYLNDDDDSTDGPMLLKGSHKFRRFPTIEDVKKFKFTKVKVSKGSILVLNTLMWHAGAPNFSENNDRSIVIAHYTPDFIKLRLDIKKNTKHSVLSKDKKNKGLLSQLLN